MLINISLFPYLKESLLLKVDDYYYYSVMKVLFVLKIHCHLVQMTFVLSVKERCPQVWLCTDPHGGSSGKMVPDS